MQQADVLIIGGGVAGLTAAHYLTQSGKSVTVLEKTEAVGGRIRSDKLDGFILDRGFQIFLTEYPEAKQILDYSKLHLHRFKSGADIYKDNKWSYLRDTREGFTAVLKSLANNPASISDLARLFKLKSRLSTVDHKSIYDQSEVPTIEYWRTLGLSSRCIDLFLKPFYKGIFLDEKLMTSSRLFKFTFKMFAEGDAVLPANGMQAIPDQIARSLPKGSVQCNKEVVKIEGDTVTVASGEKYSSTHIILAHPYPVHGVETSAVHWKENTTFYFSSDSPLNSGAYIALDPRSNSVINSVVDLTAVNPSYSRDGKSLISVSSLSAVSESEVRKDLQAIYGDLVDSWSMIKRYSIQHALPHRTINYDYDLEIRSGLYRCGDHMLEGSINGAMRSGRLVSEYILKMN